ncbi:MAG TPA: phage tail tube protein [Actinomycetota bacterium]|nr:phage tail tube protein [Actinomycetota bacterium]
MPVQKRIQFLGVAKQSAKGTPAASPTYGLGTLGGSVLVLGIDQEPDQITYQQDKRISPDENRLAINPGAAIRTRAFLRSIGLLLYGALGSLATSGVGPDYTHTITPALTLPYLTLWTQLGSAERAKVTDGKVDTLRISWSERSPLEVEATFVGASAALGEGAWTAANDETGTEKFIPPGGTFKLDAASGTPLEAKISGGEITINNNLIGIPLSKSQYPDDVYEGEQVLEVSLTLLPDDLAEWRKAVTGSGSGTSPSNTPVFGSFDLLFSLAANKQLQLVASKVAFFPEFPEGDPAGGPVELTVPGRVKLPSAGNAFTATLKNQTASY